MEWRNRLDNGRGRYHAFTPQCIVIDRFQNADDTRRGARPRHVDARDMRVGMRGEQHLAVRYSRKIDIANVAASPGTKAGVLDAANRLADPKAVHGFPRKEQALS